MQKKIYIPFFTLALAQYLFSSEIFVLIGMIFLLYEIILNKGKISINPIPGFGILILFLIWGIFLGIVNFGGNSITIRDYIRDIFYYISPIIFILLGAYYNKKGISQDRIYNTIIVWGAIKAVIIVLNIISNIKNFNNIEYIYKWRNVVGNGDYYVTIAIVILLTAKFTEYKLPKNFRMSCLVLCLTVFVLTFSRTNILIFGCLMLVVNWKTMRKRKFLKNSPQFFLMGVICIAILYLVVPHSVIGDFKNKMLSSLTEIGQSSDWNSDVVVEKNWRGYETFSALKEWKKFNLFSKVLGRGFGKKIYVGKYAYYLLKQVNDDGSPATSIAVLHNGYATNLIKLGIVGDILYIAFYVLQMKNSVLGKKRRIQDEYLCDLMLGCVIALTFITYFLNGLYKDGCPFLPLIILIGYIGNKIKIGR